MLDGPLFPNIIRYAMPVMLTSVLQLLFNATDLAVVGRFCGSVSVAAVGATGALTTLMVNVFMGLSIGVRVCTAQGLGARDEEAVHRTVHTAVPTAIISGLFLTLIGVTFSKRFLILMGSPDNVLQLSALYMKIYFCGMAFNLTYNFCASVLRASGDTKSPLLILSFSGILNVTLNVIFVTVFGLNVAGVALATTISQAVSAVLVVIKLLRRNDACKLIPSKIRIYVPQLLQIIRIGLPAGLQNSLFSIANVTLQSSINSFGDVAMSGNAAASNIEGFLHSPAMGLQQAAVNFVGQNVGAKRYDRVKKTLWISLACAVVAGLAVGGTAYLLGEQLLSLYITDSAQAISYGLLRISITFLPYFMCAVMEVTTGALRGMGESVLPMVISVLGICGFRLLWIGTVFAIPEYHTLGCLWYTFPISWAITGIAQSIAFIPTYRKHVRRLAAQTSE